jgi:hypothetical protein
MERFLRCLIENDLTALGEAPPEVLEETWITIVAEYQQLRGDKIDHVNQLRLLKLIKKTQHHLYIFELCVNFLEHTWSDKIAESLRKLNYPFNPANKTPGHYQTELQGCILRSKNHYIQLEGWLKELDEESSKHVKPSREYFETLLVNIESVQRTTYDLDKITVYKFIILEKRYNSYINALNKKKNGPRTY